LRDQIDDEILEAMRLYHKEGKKDEAVSRLNDIPLKYIINEDHEYTIKLILDAIERKEASKELENEQ